MESTGSNASPVQAIRNNENKNEISINHKHKFENHTTVDTIRSNKNKILKRQSSLDITSISSKLEGAYQKTKGTQQTSDAIHQKINGILHKTSDNNVNYNKVNKGIQANVDKDMQQTRTTNGKNMRYSKSLDETALVNKKTQTSLENINNPPLSFKISSGYPPDGTQLTRRKTNTNKLEHIGSDYYETEKQKIATVPEENSGTYRNRKLHLDLNKEEQEQQSMNYQKQIMSALNKNKSITPTDYEDKPFINTQYDPSIYSKLTTRPSYDSNRKIVSTTNNYNNRLENSKARGCPSKSPQEPITNTTDIYDADMHKNVSKTEQKKILMKKSYSMQNYSESSIDNCSNKNDYNNEKSKFRPTTKSFSFEIENTDKPEMSKKKSAQQSYVKISKPNCDILRKYSNQNDSTSYNQEYRPREIKPLILHETKITHPLESEPIEAIIGQGFADDKRIQTPLLLRQNNQTSGRNPRDYCYWTTRSSRKNSASMISDEAIIGKGFLDDEEFIEFYSTKQTKPKQVPEEMQTSSGPTVQNKKVSPKFNLNKDEIKKYFLLHGNNEPVRANIRCDQGIYNEVPVKPIVKQVVNTNENYKNDALHFNLNYEVHGEVQNKDHNNNNYHNMNQPHTNHEKSYGKRDLNQNEYVELSGGKGGTKTNAIDHHYEVLHSKHNPTDQDKIYEVPRILHEASPLTRLDGLEDDVFTDDKTVKNLGEDYLNTNTTKYRKSPLLWYINDQVISFHNDIPSIVANKKISLPVSSNIRPLGFPSSTTSYYSMHNFDMHRQNPQMKRNENYTSMIRPLVLG
ncbi:hypothetical protein M8J76_001071 [Diaphorina citri]|nr:hypothetical protein M8J76_001071 [Diaphorina citri]